MATITSTGLGSGLDINGMVDSLASINSKQVSLLQARASTTQAKLSSFGLLKSYMTNLSDIGAQLANPGMWTKTSATSSDSSSVSVSATDSAGKAQYAVQVQQLAQPEIKASKAYADSTSPLGSGTLKITFADAARPPLELDLSGSGNSLDSIKDEINNANRGVSASVVRDAQGARLVLNSGTTGTAGAMTITATDKDADTDTGLSTLAASMTTKQTGQNAKAIVNGIDIESTSNTLTGVAPGMTITLNKADTLTTRLSVGLDTGSLQKAIGDFAAAYNDLDKYISQQTKYDEAKKTAGALQADRPTLTLQSNVRSLVTGVSSASGTYQRLSDIGLEMQKNGTLTVNDAKLSKALADNPAEVAKLFAAASGDGSASGFGTRAKAMGTSMLSSDGTLALRTKSLQDSITRNREEQDKLTARTEATRQRLLKVYNAMDSQVASYKSTASALTQAITAMEASWKNSGG